METCKENVIAGVSKTTLLNYFHYIYNSNSNLFLFATVVDGLFLH